MDGRVRLALGGAATVVASVAVVCAVAVTNSAALADSPGRPMSLARIDVPVSAPSASPAARAPVNRSVSPAPTAETVPAPAPEDVTPTAPTTSTSVAPPVAPSAPNPPSAPAAVTDTSERDFLAGAAAAADWDRAIEWARSRGWSDADIARWVARNPELIAELKARRPATQTPAPGAGSPSVSDESHDGSKKDQSPSSPDRRG